MRKLWLTIPGDIDHALDVYLSEEDGKKYIATGEFPGSILDGGLEDYLELEYEWCWVQVPPPDSDRASVEAAYEQALQSKFGL